MKPDYAELHCLSNFSFLRGASGPDELVHHAITLGYTALAITDECSFAGLARAHLAARETSLKLIAGSDITLEDGLRLVLLAPERDAYGDLSQLITRGRRASTKGTYRLDRNDITELATRCFALHVPSDVLASDATMIEDQLRFIVDAFGQRARLAIELFAQAGDPARLARLIGLAGSFGVVPLAAGDVHMHVRARRALQDTLTAVRLGRPVAECGHALHPNGERHLRSRGRLGALYPRELLDATLEVAEQCTFSLEELRYEYPREIVPEGETAATWLRKLTEQGLVRRYGGGEAPRLLQGDSAWRCSSVPANVREQIEHELALIADLGYEAYFLTVEDIVAFARRREILCQGRGSAANSAVCYALGITEVDPAQGNVLFERFLSRERNEPPDIDVDFEHQRREDVMQYVYTKYGRDRAALAATLITYRPRSAVRDVGKALGFDAAQVDRLAGVFAWWDGPVIARQRIREAGFDPDAPAIRRLVRLTQDLMGFPRHLSQHVGGFVIARDLLERMVPVENATMKDRTVIQWDKDDLDSMGLLKVDCLALGMLSAIRRALDMVGKSLGRKLTMQDVPREMPSVYRMMHRADTIGVFQIESRAQQSMLPRLKPAKYYDIVIEVAIVRPGPIQGGMVHPYLRRRQGKEPVTYHNDAVKAVLERTLGVPIFQEQVMKLAMVAADFTPGEADHLRRSMAAWRRRGGLEKFEQKLVEGMAKNGYPESFARQIYQQILGFGEYGFPESHAASFALLVYISCWLKRYHPAAFTAALLNSQPMGFYAPAQLIADARRHGVTVRSAEVTASTWDCTLEPAVSVGPVETGIPEALPIVPSALAPGDDEGDDEADGADAPAEAAPDPPPETWGQHGPVLRLGLCMIKGLSAAAAKRIEAAREAAPFGDVRDLAHRAALDQRDLAALADAGALARLAGDRHQAMWEVAGVERLPPLIATAEAAEDEVMLPAPSEGDDIVADYRRLGLTLGRHPLALLRSQLHERKLATAAAVHAAPNGRLVRTAGIVIGRQRPDTASGVVFVTLEDETGTTNVVVWRDLGDRQRRELLASRLMGVYGKLERQEGIVHLVAGRLVDLTPLLGQLATRSRDFH